MGPPQLFGSPLVGGSENTFGSGVLKLRAWNYLSWCGSGPVLSGFGRHFGVVVVSSGWILMSVRAGLTGFGRHFWVVVVRSCWILISVDAGLSGFDRFWTLLDVLFGS